MIWNQRISGCSHLFCTSPSPSFNKAQHLKITFLAIFPSFYPFPSSTSPFSPSFSSITGGGGGGRAYKRPHFPLWICPCPPDFTPRVVKKTATLSRLWQVTQTVSNYPVTQENSKLIHIFQTNFQQKLRLKCLLKKVLLSERGLQRVEGGKGRPVT